MSDVGRKVDPDEGHLNREQLVAKALEFPSCTEKSFFIKEPSAMDERFPGKIHEKLHPILGVNETG